jgi:hypothetical protein
MSDRWETAYRRWLADCLREFNARYGEQRRLLADDHANPGDVVEFAEDGSAYPHGAGGTNWIPHAVTPWAQSVHFRERF